MPILLVVIPFLKARKSKTECQDRDDESDGQQDGVAFQEDPLERSTGPGTHRHSSAEGQ